MSEQRPVPAWVWPAAEDIQPCQHHFIPRRVRGGPPGQQELVCVVCKKTQKETRERPDGQQ